MARTHIDKRSRLVSAAVGLAYRNGFVAPSLADIAREAEVPLGNVYYYFKTKDEIGEAIVELRLAQLSAQRQRWNEAGSPKDRLSACVQDVFENKDFLAQRGCAVGTLCSELHKAGCSVATRATEIFAQHLAWIESQFRALGKGKDSNGLAVHLLSAMQGVSILAHSFHDSGLVATETKRLKTGVMKGMSQDRNALHGGKQVHGKGAGVFPLPECPKLALDPGQVLSEDLGRSGGDRAARLVELGAKRPDRAAVLCQAILVLEDALDAGAKPILGRSSFVPSLPLRGQSRQPHFHPSPPAPFLALHAL